jgi:polyadenylate-binding protein|mmetsp:Transcript_74501/g.125550  ORF Transcript_74501/g.125550 Transcript_74501/m.125550 type:complete len:629 (+) Transcript_74501:97-1983(+)|eukprot:CAMPEP_0174300142 /NCGR_PEP_ID=MMETSP0809-20121228/58298_1 /TAXON_ID=73025 ORGANISM="Eutreptiella gymnastica-like, Strain CCMP1594" /NCGR_SAMPLE_ID=MMETSP0809 /ASSEMBLY_ACC=CAM_ASM_000658 /LENGTH=628 /DNA_ID=CAMNT_0015405683 /DNA_START=80 /DNA_END=1966 /DNA_ORIENTATION=+
MVDAAPRPPIGTGRQASLYVGDLHTEVTEAILFDALKEVGPILSIRVCRDSITRRSLGYAYVNFQSAADAERCLESMNYTTLKGVPCRMMWSQRNPTMRKNNKANIFIKSLHSAIDNKALYDTFSAFGNILSCKVVFKQNGESAGYGFVHFESEESASTAVEKVNGMLLNQKQVYVGYFERRSKRLELHQQKFTNVYVKHLKSEVDEEKLNDAFKPFGAIKNSIIMKKDDGTSKGFAFVNYEEHDAAVKAIEELHDTTDEQNSITQPSKTLYVTRHQSKAERQHLRDQWAKERAQRLAKYINLYVKNLDDTVDDAKLRASFEPFGTIISAKVMREDKTGASRGFGFVSFRESDAANKATAEMNGKIGLSSKPIYVSPAQKKEERRLQLEMQFAQQTKSGMFPGATTQNVQSHAGVNFGYQPNFAATSALAQSGVMAGQMQAFSNYAQAQRGMGGAGPRWSSNPQNMVQQHMTPGRGRMPQGGMPMGMGMHQQRMPQHPGQRKGPSHGPGPSAPKAQQQTAPTPQQPARQPLGAGTAAAAPATGDQLTADMLRSMPIEQQKNTLGERLFSSIVSKHPDLAAKITGMLLEMESVEVLDLLQNSELLASKVTEALRVLKEHPEELKAAKEE